MTMPLGLGTRPALALAVPLLASKGPEAMSVPQLPEFDEGRCEWWHSPVVIGGTGGSGTRGVVELLGGHGVHVLGSDPKICPPNNDAGDTSCMTSCYDDRIDDLEAFASVRIPTAEWHNLTELIDHCKARQAQNVLLRLPARNRRRWGWSWKHPSNVMYSLFSIRKVFPCMHYMHVLRMPMDMAAVPFEHVGNRAAEMRRVASALGYSGPTQAGAAAYLCNGDRTCLRVVGPLELDAPHAGRGATSPAWMHNVSSSDARTRALRCWHLLLWSHVNPLVVRWAQSALRERGALQLWVSESTINANSSGARSMQASLRRDVLRLEGDEPSSRRALEYGKWIPLALKNFQQCGDLMHCGPWMPVLSAFGWWEGEWAASARAVLQRSVGGNVSV